MNSEREFEEKQVLKWLRSNGWGNPHSAYNRMKNEVVFWDMLKDRIKFINNISGKEYDDYIEPKIKSKFNITNKSLVEVNREFTKLVRSGLTYQVGSESKSVKLIDFDDVSNNDFVAINQFEFEDRNPYRSRRFDIVLFINGLPVSVIELKNVGSHSTTTDAIREIRNTYEKEIPEIFIPNIFNVVMNQDTLRYGGVGAEERFYHNWKNDTDSLSDDVEKHLTNLTNLDTMLSILNNFIFYKNGDAKILPRHQQYYSTKRVIDDVNDDNGVGEHLIVHVQGSGKSYAMLYTAYILSEYYNYPVYIIVDERDIINQFEEDLKGIDEIDECIITSENGGGDKLQEVVNSGWSGVIVTTIQMFNEVDDDDTKLNKEGVVLADEAHRYLDNILGSRMESVLEPFHYYGYTGTPIEGTYEMFSREDETYLHKYSMGEGVDEDAILPVKLTSRRDMIDWIVDYDGLEEDEPDSPDDVYAEIGTEDLAGIESRVNIIIEDIVNHFNKEVRTDDAPFKGMVVVKGKDNAARYGKKLKEKLGDDKVGVIYSKSKSDSLLVQKYHKNKSEQKEMIDSFKLAGSDPVMLVVCDKLRTGFDAPILKTLYLDRQFDGGHTLQQTIARTNRPMDSDEYSKEYGEIIDYQGTTENFEEMIEQDKEDVEKYVSEDKKKFKNKFENILDRMDRMFEDYEKPVNQLTTDDKQKRFMEEFEKLRSLHQNIKPDSFIDDYSEEYAEYKDLYDRVKTSRKGTVQDYKDDLISAVRDNITVEKDDKYDEDNNTVEQIEDEESTPLQVTRKKKTLDTIISHNGSFDTRYDNLSERVDYIIKKWNQDVIDGDRALKHLNDLLKDSRDIMEEYENSDLSDREYIVRSILKRYADSDENLDDIVKQIVDEYEENKPSNEDWLKYGKIGNIKVDIKFVLNRHEATKDLRDNEEFIGELIDKLKQYDQIS